MSEKQRVSTRRGTLLAVALLAVALLVYPPTARGGAMLAVAMLALYGVAMAIGALVVLPQTAIFRAAIGA